MSALPPRDLRQRWPLPSNPLPIVIIGAGSIVRDSHLPVYKRLGFPVVGIYDVDAAVAQQRADDFALPRVFTTLDEALATDGAVFDVAVPPGAILDILPHMRDGSAVLIQKPMGRNISEARRIREICRENDLTAAMNFQLRFAPNMLAIRDLLVRGHLGPIADVEVRLNVYSPWHYWEFLKGLARLEIMNHSIHYLDLIRSLIGEPRGVYCRGVRHPELVEYPDVRTSIILDYGDELRCSLTLNHTHDYGSQRAVSAFKIEGLRGAAAASMGVNLNYPNGELDDLVVAERGASTWTSIPLRGSWFTEAFEGPMSNLQRFVAGEDDALVSPIDDAFRTMALVEACYASSAAGGTPIPQE